MTETKTLVKPSESSDGYAHLKQDSNAKHIRLYLWLLDADPNAINTCKLFWAYVLFLPLLVLKGIFAVGIAIHDRLPEKPPTDWEAEYEKLKAKRAEKAERGPSRMERVLTKIADGLGAFWAKAEKPLTILFWIAFALLMAFTVGVIIKAIIEHPLDALKVIGIGVGTAIIVAAVLFIGDKIANGAGRRFFRLLGKLARGFHSHTCAKIDLS